MSAPPNVHSYSIIYIKYQLGHILTGKRRLTKTLDVMKPELERYTRIAGQIKEKNKARNTLLVEKKATPMLNVVEQQSQRKKQKDHGWER